MLNKIPVSIRTILKVVLVGIAIIFIVKGFRIEITNHQQQTQHQKIQSIVRNINNNQNLNLNIVVSFSSVSSGNVAYKFIKIDRSDISSYIRSMNLFQFINHRYYPSGDDKGLLVYAIMTNREKVPTTTYSNYTTANNTNYSTNGNSWSIWK